jgi:formate dehydrogenase iron-sulfur subunit
MTPKPRIYLPGDAAALAVGADEVLVALWEGLKKRGLEAEVIRNGSRGMFWLEPLIEVETIEGRIAYGPVEPGDVASLLDAGLLEGGEHRLRLGPTEKIPFLAKQTGSPSRAWA